MKLVVYLKHVIPSLLVDAVVVNLGLFLGLVARYAVLVGLNEAPRLLWGYTTPASLWDDSLQAYQAAVPLLTAITLVVFALNRSYRQDRPYQDRRALAIIRAASIAFVVFVLVSYAVTMLGYLARRSGFMPFPRSAFFAGWMLAMALLLVARQGAALWAAAREGRLTGQVVRNRYFFVGDLVLVVLAAWLSFVMRLEPSELATRQIPLLVYVGSVLAVKPAVYYLAGLYQRYWRYASIGEVVTIAGANVAATFGVILVAFVVVPIFYTFDPIPRSIPFIDFFLATAFVGTTRFAMRLVGDKRFVWRLRRDAGSGAPPSRRVLVAGAGDAGAMIVKEMQANPQRGLEPVVFLDDDPLKCGTHIHGVPVMGNRHCIREAVETYQLTQAIIAMPTAPGKTIREWTRLCQEAKIPVKTVPGMFELLDGSVTVNQLRPVEIEDLLRREPVATDVTQVTALLKGKRVLVTGAGGSIGNELCRQIARGEPAKLVLLGHGENSLFYMTNELRQDHPQLAQQTIVADIRDAARIASVFERLQPQIVFHAAAHKHVPLMEENAEDAITNNVLGTRNLVQVALESGVGHFVSISTDKAVNPTSVMGATKRVAELIVQEAAARTGRCFVAVRFGNVLGSRGSVVPVFNRQIARGGPVTVTHPEVQRYFMTIPEAVQLVLQAATIGKGGEVFVLDMGKPIKIVDLARDLIRLSGYDEDEIEIKYTGLRPGEKLYEELFQVGEKYIRTSHSMILMAQNGFDVNTGDLEDGIDALIRAARRGDTPQVRQLLQVIVPEYRPSQVGLQ